MTGQFFLASFAFAFGSIHAFVPRTTTTAGRTVNRKVQLDYSFNPNDEEVKRIDENLDHALTTSPAVFAEVTGTDLFERHAPFREYMECRTSHGVWPYGRRIDQAVGPHIVSTEADGENGYHGINFASQDYLGLSQNDKVQQAAIEAVTKWGLHSAGSGALMGNTLLSDLLQERLAHLTGLDHSIIFPTGWMAGFGVIRGLVSSDDHVIMDALCHNCLQEGALASTKKIRLTRHIDASSVERHLKAIRRRDTENGILVVTEGIFSMDADAPDLEALQDLCHSYNAKLLVDCAHDLGNSGPRGTGQPGLQGMYGKLDIVMGAFSKTFGATGGFISCNSPSVMERLQYFSRTFTFSNTMSPVLSAVVLKSLEIVDSEEGDALRKKLMENVLAIRLALTKRGYKVLGEPHAVVPVELSSVAATRLAYQKLKVSGVLVNMAEYPAVPPNRPRFRFQIMATHSVEDMERAVTIFDEAVQHAKKVSEGILYI